MCGVALGILAAQGAAAQDVNGTNVTLLERLVIGAGAPKVAIDTPQAVTVVDQEDIDAEQATSIADVLADVPGVSIIGSERLLGSGFNIRGIGTAETSGDESRIIVTVDGVKKFYEQYRMGSFFSDPELYKQVEVLRGPASSTLYGSGAIGGVINFVTKDASDFITDGKTGAVRLKGQYTSNGNGTLASGVVAHRFSENFEVLATGNWRRSEDFVLANGNTLSGSAFDAWSGLLKGTAHFGNNNEQSLRLSYQQWQSDAVDQDYARTGSLAAFGLVDRKVIDQTAVLQYANEAEDNPWLDLKINLSFSDTNVDQKNSSVGPIGDAEYGYHTWQASIENTSEFYGEAWENYLTYGVQFSHQDRTAFSTLVPGRTMPIGTHPEGQDTRLGVFVQNELVLNQDLTLIAGARGDVVWQKPTITAAEQRAVDDFAFSPKLAALYDISDNVSIFGSVAHTQRLPSLDELFQYSGTRRPSLQLEKEYANNYEAGFAVSGYSLFQDGDQASVKVTGFYSDIDGLIAANPSGSRGPYFSNIDNAAIYGVEVEGAYASELFFASLGFSAQRGENTDTRVALTSIPAHKLVLTAGARAPEYDLEYGARITLAAATDTGVAPAANPFGGAQGTPGWATLDLFASWKPQSGAWAGTEARFGIDNVFDADYRDNQTPDRSKGRTFKLTLSKQFDY
jgi:hemoglobin/transferrin/lactoferrin receptor protein